jgi:hypothetical protein
MKQTALAFLLAFCLAPAALIAQGPPPDSRQPGHPPSAFVQAPPPPSVAERPGPPPQPGFVWIAGYQRWDGGAYAWTPGHYERPPHPGAHWVGHHWAHKHGGWVMIEGHWR